MPSITSTIRMMDAMSGPLARVIKQMDTLVASAQRVNQIMNTGSNALVPASAVSSQQKMVQNNQQIVQLTQVINNNYQQINNSINNNNMSLNKTNNFLTNNINNQGRFNKKIKEGEDSAGKLLNKIMGIASAYLSFRAIKGFLGNSLDAANEQIRAEQRLQSIMRNINGMTQDGIDLVKKQAYELEKTTAIAANIGMFGQSQLAQYVYNPENITGLTEAMYNLATETYGVNVQQEQIKQTADLIGKAMMGQIDALSRNGFKLSSILSEEEIKLFKVGTEAQRTAILIEVLNENQEELARQMANTPEGKILRMNNAWADIKTTIGFGLIPTIMKFVESIQSNMPAVQDTLISVFDAGFQAAETFLKVITWIQEKFEQYPALKPIFLGLAAAIGAITVAQWALNAAINANPIALIVGLIAGLIVYLVRLWQTNDKFVAGFMRAWNSILNFFDQVPIFFKWVGNGIVNAFQWMKVKSLEILEDLINSVIDDVNSLIDLLNKIPGVSIDAVEHVSFAASAAAEAEAIKKAGEDALKLMEDNAAKKAAEREQKVLDMLDNRAAKRAKEEAEKKERFKAPGLEGMLGGGAWDSIDNINSVGEVGKIKDKVDISSEDLKTMRELAEMKNIQNFVTLAPSVVFGDTHVKNESDIQTIIARISDAMDEHIASSARGVYPA